MHSKINQSYFTWVIVAGIVIAYCITGTVMALASGVLQPNSALVNAQPSGLLSTQDWHEYNSISHRFSIRYPENLSLSTGVVFANAISGQVLAFVPVSLSDYSYTNLVNYAVLIGVTPSLTPRASSIETKNNPLYTSEILTRQKDEVNDLIFSRYYSAEGTAGHLHEKTSCRVVVDGIRYEIAMVIHSLNLGAMPAGVMSFNADMLAELFETMLQTFEVKP